MNRTNTAKWMENQSRWQINVQKDGVRRSFTSATPGRAGQREANKKADDWLEDNLVNPNMRVSDLFKEWSDYLHSTTSISHYRPYEGYWRNWIGPQINHLKIGTVHEGHLQSILDKAQVAGLAKKTQRNIKACMTAFIKYARIRKATVLIIDTLAVHKAAKSKQHTILQPEDLKKLFSIDTVVWHEAERTEPYINAFRFAVVTGLRPGELIGLQWGEIKEDAIHLQRSINRYNEETSGKNENARRTFILTPIAQSVLQDQKLLLESMQIEPKFVFPSEDGEHIRQATYYNRWVRYRDHAGISPASPYELRHTFVSMVKSLPEGLLKSLVGHSKDMDTYGIYSHEIAGDKVQTASLMQDIFSKLLA